MTRTQPAATAEGRDEIPRLDWIGEAAVVNHQEVPYRLLHCDKERSVGSAECVRA